MPDKIKLKPCPFCSALLVPFGADFTHPINDCWLRAVKILPHEFDAWNRRSDDGSRSISDERALGDADGVEPTNAVAGPRLQAWLKSPEGQKAIQEGMAESQRDLDRLNAARVVTAESLSTPMDAPLRAPHPTAKDEQPQAQKQADELHFNATRLRNVARLVGLESAVPEDDATLDGARGSVLGMIAGKLRATATNAGELPQLPCPVCGGEALHAIDTLQRIVICDRPATKDADDLKDGA